MPNYNPAKLRSTRLLPTSQISGVASEIKTFHSTLKMNHSLQVLFDSLKVEMQKQTNQIHDSVTKTMNDSMEEKLKVITDENKILKSKIISLEEKIVLLERENKKKNLLLFGLEEKEKDPSGLVDIVKEKIKNDLEITLEISEINKLHRIGRKSATDTKVRPVLISFVNEWRKIEIIKNKKRFNDVYVTEDYPKAILEKRKELQGQLEEERRKGNQAYIKYDKIVINSRDGRKDSRKRVQSTSPEENQSKKYPYNPPKAGRLNAFEAMMAGPNSRTVSPSPDDQE